MPAMLAGLVICAASFCADLPDGWTMEQIGDPMSSRLDTSIDDAGRPVSSLVLGFPANTWSEPGWRVHVATRVIVPNDGKAELTFSTRDSFDGPTAGYHYAVIRSGDALIWERDVAGGNLAYESDGIDLREAGLSGEVVLTFGLEERKAVSNFPIEIEFAGVRLVTDDGATDLLPPPNVEAIEPLPPDLPIPARPIVGEDWTRRANILQPWGRTQGEILKNVDERVPWLASEFGFDAVIMLPPEAHNRVGPEGRVTHEQFLDALNIFRREGFRIILYSSVMHVGHAPVWEDGTTDREHPEWAQRGPDGGTIKIYGHDWLCPSTGALDFTIDYTVGIVETYEPDAIMLDNNQFMYTDRGLTCHCEGCQAGFKDYCRERFGDTVLGQPVGELLIPKEPGPLHNLWLRFRNRVWAQTNEAFRDAFAERAPGTVLLANTQYLYGSPALATDMQYAHEDAMLSESRSQDLRGMVSKLLLGTAISAGRPVWNYLGSFDEDDFTKLRPANEIAMNVSTAYASGARPWVVYYGFVEHPEDEANAEALRRMASNMRWHTANDPAGQNLRPHASVLSLISHNSRNCKGDALVPKHLADLRRALVPARLVEEMHLTANALADAQVLLISEATCLEDRAAEVIADWVRGGGRLYATPKAGAYDEIGRLRLMGSLLTALGLDAFPTVEAAVGEGAVCSLSAVTDIAAALSDHAFALAPKVDAEVLPHVTESGELLVYVCSESPLPDDLTVRAPGGLAGTAIICSADKPEPRVAPLVD